jgi:DNA (cytosine-5)-methyltransferase 1
VNGAYYNEIDPYCAQWLRNLMDAGHIPAGDIDTRSIEDVTPNDLRGYVQSHFFAGIGGWPLALRLAGWPDSRPVWTGSCPCQPFSAAGKRAGFADKRHLWPSWQHLISQRQPPVLFGEQVASAADWLDLVLGDLEALDYAVVAKPIEAASAGADHFRDRYWIVADHDEQCAGSEREQRSGKLSGAGGHTEDPARLMADSRFQRSATGLSGSFAWNEGRAGVTDDCGRKARAMADRPSFGWGEGWTEHDFRSRGLTASVISLEGRQYIECADGKEPVWRPLPPPGVRWLGNGIPARVAKLRALGNAIDIRPASQFIAAYLEARGLIADSQQVAA